MVNAERLIERTENIGGYRLFYRFLPASIRLGSGEVERGGEEVTLRRIRILYRGTRNTLIAASTFSLTEDKRRPDRQLADD